MPKYRVKAGRIFFDNIRGAIHAGNIVEVPREIGDKLYSVLEPLEPQVPATVPKPIPPAALTPIRPVTPSPILPPTPIIKEEILPLKIEEEIIEETEKGEDIKKLTEEVRALTLVRELRAFAEKHNIDIPKRINKPELRKKILREIEK